MENGIDYENLTYSVMAKAGYSRNDLGPVHNSMIVGSKKFGSGSSPIFKGEVKEQDFYSENFQVARYFEEAHDAKWQCLFFRHKDRIVKLEELDYVSTLEVRAEKDHFQKVETMAVSIDGLALQICDLLELK
jgi:hypothetical protein